MKKIAKIATIVPEIYLIGSKEKNVRFEIISPQGFVVIYSALAFFIINIFTRKVIMQHSYYKDIRRMIYIIGLDIFAIAFDSCIRVYDFSKQISLSKALYSFSLAKIEGRHGIQISLKDNVIVYYYQQIRESITKCGDPSAININMFDVIVLNRQGAKEYSYSCRRSLRVVNCKMLIYPALKIFSLAFDGEKFMSCSFAEGRDCYSCWEYNGSDRFEGRRKIYIHSNHRG